MVKKAERMMRELGGIAIDLFDNAGLADVYKRIGQCEGGIFLANENSMVNTELIDILDGGLVGRQSVDLKGRLGNSQVLKIVDLMKSKKNTAFFPGTLLRDFGGYVLPTMPVVVNGKLEVERVKQTDMPYVDDYKILAAKILDKDYAEKVKSSGGALFEEPYRTIVQKLEQITTKQRAACLRPVNFNGLEVLPVICNEISLIPQLYSNKPLDVILHSSSDLYESDDSMLKSYTKVMNELQANGKLSRDAILAYAEIRSNGGSKGIFAYSGGKLKRLN